MFKPLPHISIVGFGRFGRVLYRLLKDDFVITVYRRSEITNRSDLNAGTVVAKDLSEIYLNDTIFFAVPIDSFEDIIASHKRYFKKRHLLIDVLSVKLHAAAVFEKYLKGSQTKAMLTHPMFGPDSSKNGFADLPIIISQFRATESQHSFWKRYFLSKKLKVIEMSPDAHDRLAAKSQGLTHFIGRMLEQIELEASSIDSDGTKKLLEVKDVTCNDSWQLFANLQQFNPYAREMQISIEKAHADICSKLKTSEKNQIQLETT